MWELHTGALEVQSGSGNGSFFPRQAILRVEKQPQALCGGSVFRMAEMNTCFRRH